MNTISIPASRAYDVKIARGLLAQLGPLASAATGAQTAAKRRAAANRQVYRSGRRFNQPEPFRNLRKRKQTATNAVPFSPKDVLFVKRPVL